MTPGHRLLLVVDACATGALPHQQYALAHCLRPTDGPLQSPETAERCGALMQWLLPRCLRFVRGSVKEISPSMDNNLVIAAARLLTALLLPDPDISAATNTSAGESPLAGSKLPLLWPACAFNQPSKDASSTVSPGDAMRRVRIPGHESVCRASPSACGCLQRGLHECARACGQRQSSWQHGRCVMSRVPAHQRSSHRCGGPLLADLDGWSHWRHRGPRCI
jgi:hypothetical protein